MCRLLGIEKTRTTPYNPKNDGMIERFNRTLVAMVSMMLEPHRRQRDWDEKIPLAMFAYRASPQESTGESPNMLMLGREVLLPVDLTIEQHSDGQPDEDGIGTDYAQQLREQLSLAHDRARKCLKQSARRQKNYYDRRSATDKLVVGEFAWLHNPAKKKGVSPKLQCRWEGPYLIVHQLSEVIFRIQRKKRGKMKVVHRDRLKPYTGEPLVAWIEDGSEETSTSTLSQRQPENRSPARTQVSGSYSNGQSETPIRRGRPLNPNASPFTIAASPQPAHAADTPNQHNPFPGIPTRRDDTEGPEVPSAPTALRRNPPGIDECHRDTFKRA
ncbi:uncharacterized protein LOC110988783 [Acanthaster planci]|uniref:Uncharacterized protein LOC110988783 n=1 Tax=Acanthaster planci TaxID=133434 RepID=A0A8B7ZU15_ACAPL|nr:uncharacterized protein LOC110988783 [Acanthaster planci]